MLILTCLASLAISSTQADIELAKALRLTVEVARDEVVLYEPVLVKVTIENVGDGPVLISPFGRSDLGKPHVRLASVTGRKADGPPPESEYWPFRSSLVGVAVGEARPRRLSPGATDTHVEGILWHQFKMDERPARGYVMPAPGVLWVKARFAYDPDDPRKYIDSTPVAVTFHPVPEEEANYIKSWKRPHVACFVQYGSVVSQLVEGGENNVYEKRALRKRLENEARGALVQVVDRGPFSKSAYSFYAWHALNYWRKYVDRTYPWPEDGFEDLAIKPGVRPSVALGLEGHRIREARRRRAEMLFPDDRRLDFRVTYHFPEPTPIEAALKQVSEQTGEILKAAVPLHVDPSLRQTSMNNTIEQTVVLRDFMKTFATNDNVWIPEGDGYLWTTVEKARAAGFRVGQNVNGYNVASKSEDKPDGS